MNYDYGNAFERFPCDGKTAVFEDGSQLRVHDIMNPLPSFMKEADIIFTDSPWNTGNLRTFYTKAQIIPDFDARFETFYKRLFECIGEINPRVAYTEIGKEYLADYIMEMRRHYPYVTFFNSTYYHKQGNMCYVVRGSRKAARGFTYDYVDEEDIIKRVCGEEEYDYIGDLCMGQGLVAVNAFRADRRFVGTELNHKRLSVTLERLNKLGAQYILKENDE